MKHTCDKTEEMTGNDCLGESAADGSHVAMFFKLISDTAYL